MFQKTLYLMGHVLKLKTGDLKFIYWPYKG